MGETNEWDHLSPEDQNELLLGLQQGKKDALDRVFVMLYNGLRDRSSAIIKKLNLCGMKDETALLHSFNIKWVSYSKIPARSFYSIFSLGNRSMTQLLIDEFFREKRESVGIDHLPHPPSKTIDPNLAIAIQRLSETQPLESAIGQLRMEGWTLKEVATALDLKMSTVNSIWQNFKLAMYQRL